ncbi:MAG: DF family (seleno)protein [Solirubrobacteraceae bacterium]
MTTPTPTPITIEILYFDGCPSHEQLVEHLPRLLEREGITANIVLRDIPDIESALAERFLGSPTVRIDGRDIEAGAAKRDDYGLKCRIYKTEAGLVGLPADKWILDVITADRGAPE